MNELKISDKMLSLLFAHAGVQEGRVRLLQGGEAAPRVVGGARNAMTALQELLRSPDCMLTRSTSPSRRSTAGRSQAMKANSCSALDMYGVPRSM